MTKYIVIAFYYLTQYATILFGVYLGTVMDLAIYGVALLVMIALLLFKVAIDLWVTR